MSGSGPPAAIELDGVTVFREGVPVLRGIDWHVAVGQRWVILGPNGSGKTTLLQVAAARLWPTTGTVEVLGARLGQVDVRTLRPRIALVSGAVTRQLRADLPARTWWSAAATGLSRPGGTTTRMGTGREPTNSWHSVAWRESVTDPSG